MKIKIDRFEQFNSIQNKTLIISNDIVYLKTFIKNTHLLIPLEKEINETELIQHEDKTEFIKLLKEFFDKKNFELFYDNYELNFVKKYDVSDDYDNLQLGDFIYMAVVKEWFYICKIKDDYVLLCLEDNYSDMTHSSMEELTEQVKKAIHTLNLSHYNKNNVELIIKLN